MAARLFARLFEAKYTEMTSLSARRGFRRYLAAAPTIRRGETVLVIAPEPVDLYAIADLSRVWARGATVAAWVVDSWWEDRIPRLARSGRHFDLLLVSEQENVAGWQRATGLPVHWFPQGTDALALGSGQAERPVVVQRVGRQPTTWEDDESNALAAAQYRLTYGSRPPFSTTPEDSIRSLLNSMSLSRYVLAFSNASSPGPYTHPTREYLTSRWTDALSAGAVVAGISPRCASRDRLWPEALLELDTTDRTEGLATIAEHNASWTPSVAHLNHLRALETLDWRWRVSELAEHLGIGTPTLAAEKSRLRQRILDVGAQCPGS